MYLHSAKYLLATWKQLNKLFGGQLGIGYNIGCAEDGTLQHSPLLLQLYATSGSRFMVPAFHGWAHNRLCQLHYHVQMVKGMGLEDLETSERIYSASNEIARALRHASKFTHHQFIVLYFQHWNLDMRDRLGTLRPLFLCSNIDSEI